MKWIQSCESVFGKMGGKGGGVVVSDATAANDLFGTVGTKMKVLNLLLSGENYGIKNAKVSLLADCERFVQNGLNKNKST